MQKKFSILFALIICTAVVFAESPYQKKYLQLLSNNQLDELSTYLKKWESEKNDDIELYIAYFNFYTRKGFTSENVMGKMPDGRYGIFPRNRIKNPEASYAEKSLDKALQIDADRIDVYLGKMQFLQMQEDYVSLKKTIIAMLNRIDSNKNNWRWKDGVNLKEAGKNDEEMIINSINNCISPIRENNELIDFGFDVSKEEYKYFPDNIIAMNHYASYLLDKGNFDDGIRIFLRANKKDPKDLIIVANLGMAYEKIKQIDNAKKYYLILTKSNEEQFRDFGIKALERINNKK